jgi:hypothetical protein
MMNAIVTFVSSNDISKLDKCGMTIPPEFIKLKTDLATLILPFMYIGMPVILIVVGVLMFLGGFYYNKSRFEDEKSKKDQMEREMVHKLVRKLDVGKSPGAGPPSEPSEPETVEETSEPETPEESEEIPPEPEEVKPAAKTKKKRK